MTSHSLKDQCFLPKRRTDHQEHNTHVKTTNIMIVDDHPLVRNGFRQLIESEPDFSVCCEAATISEALELLARHKPDIAIIDLSLPDGSGIDLIKRMHSQFSHIPVLVSSMHDVDIFAERALRAGAKGYINKQEAGEQVIIAARHILKGKIYLSPQGSNDHLPAQKNITGEAISSPTELLSDRELEVFELIGHGMTTSEIADKLHLSVKTIESHRANIKSKLGLHSAGELTRSAVQWTLET